MALSEARKRANAKYNAKAYDRLELKVLKGNKEIIQSYCKDKGTSVNNLMNNLLSERLTKDGYKFITRQHDNTTATKPAPNNAPRVTAAALEEDEEHIVLPWEEDEEEAVQHKPAPNNVSHKKLDMDKIKQEINDILK